MRITRDTLLKAAKTYVMQQTMRDRHVICVYLTGSLIDDLPLLGGTADIDLVFVHDDTPPAPREIVRLTPTVHLDLAHHDQTIYKEPKKLRLDPWVGSYLIKDPVVLYGTQHWFEYVQAIVASQFSHPENVYQRGFTLAEKARQTWLDYQLNPQEADIQHIWAYLKALEEASNALVILNDPPLTERRFLLDFPDKVTALGYPEMAANLINLFIPNQEILNDLSGLIKTWSQELTNREGEKAYPVELHPHRINYYTSAVEALSMDHPAAAMWILLRTWTRYALYFKDSPEKTEKWFSAFSDAFFLGEHFQQRLDELDQYLDKTEEIIENWGKTNGINFLA
jgi:hypothetical protein